MTAHVGEADSRPMTPHAGEAGATPRIRPRRWRPREARRLALRYLAAVLITGIFLFPIYWLFMIAFKTPEEIFASPPVWYPASLQLENFKVLFKDGDAVTVWNSLVVASISTVLAMLLGTSAAYSLALSPTIASPLRRSCTA